MELIHGSFFSGIGGFEEGAQLAGIKTVFSIEIEKYQRKILRKNYPNTKIYEDITKTKSVEFANVFSGGFPCQDISIAGKGKGINGERSGLWAEMFRFYSIYRPRYGIIENSPMLTFRGLERILYDLSQIGYDAEWQSISNYAFGFPHKRERIYIIAYPNEIGSQSNIWQNRSFEPVFRKWTPNKGNGYFLCQRFHEIPKADFIGIDDGFQNWTHRVSSLGNSVNPIVAMYLFECIKKHHELTIK